jgi:hypothetical protein
VAPSQPGPKFGLAFQYQVVENEHTSALSGGNSPVMKTPVVARPPARSIQEQRHATATRFQQAVPVDHRWNEELQRHLDQSAANLAKQRAELQQLRRAVEAAEALNRSEVVARSRHPSLGSDSTLKSVRQSHPL